jgi:type IV pilus assembly protein PilB
MASNNLASTLRRSLLIKVISKPAPSKEDVSSVIELTASKVVEALQAQSMTFYLVEGNEITFRQVYYSPTLWSGEPARQKDFEETAAKLLALRLPTGKGIVGKVIETGEPSFYRSGEGDASAMQSMKATTGFDVKSMLTVPLKTTRTLGAIQVLNKELAAGTNGAFTDRDLALLKEVAEYSSTLIHRMVDPKFVPNAEDTARFVARLTELPLVTKIEDIPIDEKLLQAVGRGSDPARGHLSPPAHRRDFARGGHDQSARLRQARGVLPKNRTDDRGRQRRLRDVLRCAREALFQGRQEQRGHHRRRRHRLSHRDDPKRL